MPFVSKLLPALALAVALSPLAAGQTVVQSGW